MRSGFTLLEVLVAVMIAATLLLSADVVFEQLADSRAAAERAATEWNRTENDMALIRRWVRQVEVSPGVGSGSTHHAFAGDSATARFTSSCIVPGGWERECDVSFHVTSDSTGASLVAVSSAGDSARLGAVDRSLALRYLSDAAGNGRWANSWPSGPTAPLAIVIVTRKDTLLLRIGARG
jgi:prepilin-type N-terminal cleavage/methylation domain-containing protein